MKARSKLIYLLAILFILPTLSSCSYTRHKVKVAFMLPNLTNSRYQKEKEYFTAKARKENMEVWFANGNDDDNLQIIQADSFIQNDVDVIVISCVNKNTASQIVRQAHRHGIKVIAYDRIINFCDLDCFYSFDNVKVGELMASYALKYKPAGNYILLGGDKSDQNAIWVKEGQMNMLMPQIKAGKIHILYDIFVEDWNSDNANYELSRFYNLITTKPDAILAASDGISAGVARALLNQPIPANEYPVVTGQNANLTACRNIVRGLQTMTIYKPLQSFAEGAVELALALARNEKITYTQYIDNNYTNVPAILKPVTVVDKSNVKSTIIADGYLTEQEIYTEK